MSGQLVYSPNPIDTPNIVDLPEDTQNARLKRLEQQSLDTVTAAQVATTVAAATNVLSAKTVGVVSSFSDLTASTVPVVTYQGRTWVQKAGTPDSRYASWGVTPAQNGYYYALQLNGSISPELFGAVGNRVVDDTTAFQAAINAAVATGLPLVTTLEKQYRITAQLVPTGPLVINHVKGSEIWFDSTTTVKRLFYTQASFTLTGNGQLTGSWSMAGQGSPAVASSQISGQSLIFVEGPGSGTINVFIDGIVFRRAGSSAITITQAGASGNRFNSLIVQNTDIQECYNGAHYNSLNNPGELTGAVFRNNIIKTTALGTPGASGGAVDYAGNGFTGWGQLTDLRFEGNLIDNIGRMGVELFIPGDQFLNLGYRNRKLQITNNTISNCGYFCLSQQGDGNYIARNTIKSSHGEYIEMQGNDILIESNRLDGTGFSTTSSDRGQLQGRDRNNLVVRGNTFIQRSFQKTIIEAAYTENLLIEKNTILLTEARDTGSGFRSPISVQSSLNPTVRGNYLYGKAPFVYSFYNFGKVAGMTWNGDQLYLSGYSGGGLANLFDVSYVRSSTFQNIRVITETPLQLSNTAFNVLHYANAGMYSYVWNGSSFVITQLASSSVTTTPPASPATNASYWVGDGATGAWAGQDRKLAKWDGSAWGFSTVVDVYPYSATSTQEPVYSHFGLPTKATTVGTTYLLLDGSGLFNVRFDNNDFSSGGNLTDSDGKTCFRLYNTRLWNVGVINTGETLNTNDLQIGDITVQKTIVSSTDLSNYLTAVTAASTYTTQTQNDARYIRGSVAANLLTLASTDSSGNGQLQVAGTRFIHTYNNNTFIGVSSGNPTFTNITGTQNTILGKNAGQAITTAGNLLFAGQSAGLGNTTGSRNIFLGPLTGTGVTTGNDNVFVGNQAGNGSTPTAANSENVFIGTSSGINNVGSDNAFVGYSTANNGTFVESAGLGAGAANMANAGKTFTRCNFIGRESGRNISGTSFTNVTFIGHDAGNGETDLTNGIIFGKSATPLTGKFYGSFSASVSSTTPALIGSGTAPTVAVGAGAGTGATVSISGTALSGRITLTTGTSPAAGTLVTVTLTSVSGLTLYPVISSANSTNLPVGTGGESATGYTITTAATPSASATYYFNYFNPR